MSVLEGQGRVLTLIKSYKEYLFGLETLVFAISGIFSMHNQLVTEIASYDPFKVPFPR